LIGYRSLQLVSFAIDGVAERPIAILKDGDGETTFPLWLNTADVAVISAELITREHDGQKDLLSQVLDGLGLKAEMVILDGDLAEGYRAVVTFSGDDGELEVSVHPATALAASLKYRLPVQVSEEALSSSALVDLRDEHPLAEQSANPHRELLKNLDTAQMGKYPM
jgi:uncharacterized protein